MQCEGCKHINPDDARFCGQCGAAMARLCGACQAPFALGQKFCANCGISLAPPVAESSPVDLGERRQVTVVFSDLSGYTALNEKLDPEEVEVIMGRIKRRASEIVDAQGGTVNQFVGDEIMMLFGVPVARRDDPHRATRAALELHRAVNEIAAEVAPRVGRVLSMHTGINSGLIVARRSDARAGRYTVTGDPINTGARLLSLARADEIVVGHETWRQISGEFVGEAGAAIEVKGKQLPVVPYRIQGERTAAEASRRPLVGRAEEMRQFSALAHSCLERRRGRLIVLRGDPGIGKSRLAHEFVSVARRRGFACHSALVLDFSAERGRDTIRSIARSLLAIEPGADETARRAAIADALADGRCPVEFELFLHDLLDLEAPAALRRIESAITDEVRQKGTLDTLRELVARASRAQPQMLVIEDVHWADAWTLERLAAIAVLTADHPLLLALTTRFDGDPSVGAWRGTFNRVPTTGIDLAPLALEDALHMTEQFGSLASELQKAFIERAEGNPLFLEQLLLSAGDVESEGVPGSIQALVLARMDRLDATDRLALHGAAILGQRFSLEAVRHVIEDPAYQPERLVAHFLVRPEGIDYLFCHALIRDGAYESLLKSRRRALHTRAAEWFARSDRVLAAQHYDRAEHDAAARAYLLASEAEVARYHYSAALALAQRGQALAATREDSFALASMHASVLNEMGQARAAIDAWRSALEFCADGAERCRVLMGLAQGMRIVDETEQGMSHLAEAEALATAAELTLERSQIHYLRGNYYFGAGRAAECLAEHEQALHFANQVDSIEAQANALGGIGDAHYVGGRMRSACEGFQRCVELAHRHGLGRIEVANQHMVGWSMHYLGPLREPLALAYASVAMAERVSHRRVAVIAQHLVVYLKGYMMGETREARVHLDSSLAISQALGARRFESQNMTYRAQLALREGDRPEALRLARAALEFTRAHGMDFYGAIVLGLLARLTPDGAERTRLNAEAQERLAQGAIAHNHFEYYKHAIDSALERGAWQDAEGYAEALTRYTASEPLPWSDFMIARAIALARHGRGARDAPLLEELRRLRELAASNEYNVMIAPLDAALAEGPG